MKVSVVIPVHNAERYLRACLDSVLSQTFRHFEVICVDDGSTDGSAAILAEYAERDPRLRVVTGAKADAGAARNAGYAASSGEYLLFLDADDVFAPTLVETLVRGIEASCADVAICRYESFPDGCRLPPFSREAGSWRTIEAPASSVDIFRRWMGWSWDKLFRRSLIERHALRFQEIAASNDLAFVFAAVSLAQRIAETDAVLVAHRLHAGSIEAGRDRTPLCCIEALREYRNRMIAAGAFSAHPELERAFKSYVPRFVFWYLYTITDKTAYDRLKTALPAAAGEFGVAGTLPWLGRGFLCRIKRPIRQFVRSRGLRR